MFKGIKTSIPHAAAYLVNIYDSAHFGNYLFDAILSWEAGASKLKMRRHQLWQSRFLAKPRPSKYPQIGVYGPKLRLFRV